jgi:release factor glutamine methyltransferase
MPGAPHGSLAADCATAAHSSPVTIKQLLHEASARLRRATDAPRLEAEVLLGHVLSVSRTALLAHPERLVEAGQEARFSELFRRRAEGFPLPYLTGCVEFYGFELEVTPDVLIPRPETETLVDLALARQPATVVDVGTGSGCIAVALAVRLPECVVTAIDISPGALTVAQRNVARHGVAERVELVLGDLLAPCPGPVDLIVSNPPYILAAERPSLPASVRMHEPWLALDGGPDGLAVIRRLLAQAPVVLRSPEPTEGRPGGALLIEIGADQGPAALRLASAVFPQAELRVHTDLAGRDRVLEVQT